MDEAIVKKKKRKGGEKEWKRKRKKNKECSEKERRKRKIRKRKFNGREKDEKKWDKSIREKRERNNNKQKSTESNATCEKLNKNCDASDVILMRSRQPLRCERSSYLSGNPCQRRSSWRSVICTGAIFLLIHQTCWLR